MNRMRTTLLRALVSATWLTLAIAPAAGDDWPAWRGAHRDSLCKEAGLLQSWPPEGPPLLWKMKGLGEGLSGPAIVGDRLYTMGNSDGKEKVLALDLAHEGKPAWSSAIGEIRHLGGGYPGPRATPCIDGTRLYALGINGDLVCMDTKDGRILWSQDLVREFGGKIHDQGYSESPLVDGPWVISTPGMKKATMVALDKMTGSLVWAAPVGDPAAHASVVKFTSGGVEQYVTVTGKGVISVRAKDGQFLWRNDHPAINCMTVVTSGDTVFVSNEHGGGTLSIRRTADGFEAKELYFTNAMKNYHGGVVLVDAALYGSSNNMLTCLDYLTGDVRWSDRGPGKCSVLYADGCLYCRDEGGTISLVEATPDGFHLKGQFKQPDRSRRQAWPHLVIADRRLYVRDQDVLLCYDVSERKR
jgi:outer membrane protein assembly factor BamB